jgi:hypothetical protein
MKQTFLTLLFSCLFFFSATAQTTHYAYSLLKDGTPGVNDSEHLPQKTYVNGFTYWVAASQGNDTLTIWKSDTLANLKKIFSNSSNYIGSYFLLGAVNNKVLVYHSGAIWRIENDVLVRVDASSNIGIKLNCGVSNGFLHFVDASSAIYRTDGVVIEKVVDAPFYGSGQIAFVKAIDNKIIYVRQARYFDSLFVKEGNSNSFITRFIVGVLTPNNIKSSPQSLVFNGKVYFETANRKLYETDGTLNGTKQPNFIGSTEVLKQMTIEGNELWCLTSSALNIRVKTVLLKHNGSTTTTDTLRLGTYNKPIGNLVNGGGQCMKLYNKTYVWIQEGDSLLIFGINPSVRKITSVVNGYSYNTVNSINYNMTMTANPTAAFFVTATLNNVLHTNSVVIPHQTQQAEILFKDKPIRDIFSAGSAILLNAQVFPFGSEPCRLVSCTNPIIPITNVQADTINRRVRLQWDVPLNSNISKFLIATNPSLGNIDSTAYIPNQTHYSKIVTALDPASYNFVVKTTAANRSDVCNQYSSDTSNRVTILNCPHTPPTATLQVIPQQPLYNIKWTVNNPGNSPIQQFILTRSSPTQVKISIIPYIAGQNTYEYLDTLILNDYNIRLDIQSSVYCSNSTTAILYTTTFTEVEPQALHLTVDSIALPSGKNVRIKVKVDNQYKIKPYRLNIYRKTPNDCDTEVLYTKDICTDSVQIDTIQYKGTFTYFAEIAEPTYTVPADPKTLNIQQSNNYLVAKDFTANIVDFGKIAVSYKVENYLGTPMGGFISNFQLYYRKQGTIAWESAYAPMSFDSIVRITIAPTQVGIYELRAATNAISNCFSNLISPTYTINKTCAQNLRFDRTQQNQRYNTADLYIPYCYIPQAQRDKDRANGIYTYCPPDSSFIRLNFVLSQYIDSTNHLLHFTIERKRASLGQYKQIYEGSNKGFQHPVGPWEYRDYALYDDDSINYRIIIHQPDICGGNDTLNLNLNLSYFPNYYQKGLSIFPTMVLQGYTHIYMPNPNATARAEFFNTLGQSVAVFQNLSQFQPMDINHLTEGVYIVYLTNSDGYQRTMKIQKR